VRPDIADSILAFQWRLTLEALRILSGEADGQEPPLLTIAPATKALAPPQQSRITPQDEDAKRFLLAMAACIGTIELTQRTLRGIPLALALGDIDDIQWRCPHCGYVLGETSL
jgi:hypothetical protein